MAAGKLDLELVQGQAFGEVLILTGMNLQSYSVGTAQIRRSYASNILSLSLTVSIVASGTTGGSITLIAALEEVNSLGVGQYEWDFYLSGPANNPSPEQLLFGDAIVKARVTR